MTIKRVIGKILNKQRDYRTLAYDNKHYLTSYASSLDSDRNGRKQARDILVLSHVVEKGLSHKELKPLFGYDRVKVLANSLEEYIKLGGGDQYIIDLAFSTIDKYNSVNSSLGVQDSDLVTISGIDCRFNKLDVGAKKISIGSLFNSSFKSFEDFSMNRHSLRLFDNESLPISLDDVIECVRISQSAPSACNRQSTRVKIISDKDLIREIVDIQGGAKGFGEHSGMLVVITADISLYLPDERRLPMLDAGLFIMNFVYSCYDKKIGTCILNGSFSIEREKRISQLLPIPDNEMFISVIALSRLPDDEEIMIANSPKRDVQDIVTVY